ncbi:MAG: cytochrome c [Paracoccaceae bacterium]|nr:cytochrome c [Paracoccaceae bacterium]
MIRRALPLLFVFAAPSLADSHGEAVYAEHCAACHGAALEGQPDWRAPKPDGTLPAPPHDETGHTWHHGDGLLFDYIKRGGQAVLADAGIENFSSAMPGFGHVLSDADITVVLDYIKSTWPPRIVELQQTRTEAEALYGN